MAILSDSERIARARDILARLSGLPRPVWIGCDGWLRLGRGDTAVMLEDLGYRTSAQ